MGVEALEFTIKEPRFPQYFSYVPQRKEKWSYMPEIDGISERVLVMFGGTKPRDISVPIGIFMAPEAWVFSHLPVP